MFHVALHPQLIENTDFLRCFMREHKQKGLSMNCDLSKVKLLVMIAVSFIGLMFLVGCREPDMSARFKRSRPVILIDEQGHRYVAEHHIGDTYTLKHLPDK